MQRTPLAVLHFLASASGVVVTPAEVVTPEDVMRDVGSEEHLQLLQVSARRHQQNTEAVPGVLSPEDTQGPYVTLGLNSVCPDDQILTLRQCAQAVWSGVVADADPVRAPQTYGCGNIFENSPRGCNVWVGGRGNKMVYYNPSPNGRANPEFKAICSTNGGFLAEKADEVTLPAGGVEKLPASTECPEGTLLTSLYQCKLAAEALGLASAMRFAAGYPHWTTFQNEQSSNRAVDQQAAPLGCTQFYNNLVYWNMDTKDDFYKSAPHHWRRPICAKVPQTTTTPAPPTTTTTPAPPTTTPAPMQVDSAVAVGDPHITTDLGTHQNVE